jgi:hypothetical protein
MRWHDACKECPRMKMRLQIASVLPAPAKLEPDGSNGKGIFGATFQEMMETSGSAGAGLGVMGQAWSGRQEQMGALLPKLRAGKTTDESADEAGLASEAAQTGTVFRGTPKLTDQSEAIGGRIVPQAGREGAPFAKEPATEPAVRDPAVGQPIVPNSSVRTPPRVTPAQNEPQAAPTTTGAVSPLSASSKDASQHATHKAEATHDGTHAAADQALSVMPVIPQPTDFIVPVTALQPGEPQPAPSKPAPNAISSGVHGQAALRRAPTQPMISDQAELSGKSFAGLGSQMRAQAANTLAGEGRKAPHRTPSTKTDGSTGPRAASLTEKNISATAVTSETPAPQSKAAHPLAESIEATSSQIDLRAVKDAPGKPGTEVKSELSLNVPVHAAPGSPAVEHQPPNLAPTILHETAKAIATHRPETSVAQVLQRMDGATSSGVVQLRADARRLEVGVSSGSLGWVEVKATTGPAGRVDATLQAQNDASAHVLADQSSEIFSYAREHSVQLGQLSVGVGTGDSAQGESRSTDNGARYGNATPVKEVVGPPANAEQAYYAEDAVSLISIRA